ncbi:MAG: hypothetical protein ACPGSK_03510 [Alphaproteobacteria bacterium]
MTRRAGRSPGAEATPRPPESVIAVAIHSWSGWLVNGRKPAAAEVHALAAHITAQCEHGGYPLTCLHKGHVVLDVPSSAEDGKPPENLDTISGEFSAKLKDLDRSLQLLQEEATWLMTMMGDQRLMLAKVMRRF